MKTQELTLNLTNAGWNARLLATGDGGPWEQLHLAPAQLMRAFPERVSGVVAAERAADGRDFCGWRGPRKGGQEEAGAREERDHNRPR